MAAKPMRKEHPTAPPPSAAPAEPAAAPAPLMPENIREKISELEQKIIGLLPRQHALAEDLNAEKEYLAVVAEGVAAYAEIDRLNSLLSPPAPKETNVPAPAAPAPFVPDPSEPAPEQPAAPPPVPGLTEQLRQRISELKERAADLEQRQFQLAEKSINDPAAVADYNAAVAEQATVNGDIDRLTTAIASIEARAVSEAAAGRAAESTALRKRVADMLDTSMDAARAFEASLGATVKALRDLVQVRENAWRAWPGPQPIGLALVGAEIIRLVAAEMYRQGVSPPKTGGLVPGRVGVASLPAPKCPRLELLDLPGQIPSLVAELEQATQIAKNVLEGRS